MSMFVRKATLVRPGRSRRNHSQRAARLDTIARYSRGATPYRGDVTKGETSTSRSTIISFSMLRSSQSSSADRTSAASPREKAPGVRSHCQPAEYVASSRTSGPSGFSPGQGPGDSSSPRSNFSKDSDRHIWINKKSTGQTISRDESPGQHTRQGEFESQSSEERGENRPGLPRRQIASSLKESELSKPVSDLPFTRSDLPVRHSSLPAKRLDSASTTSSATSQQQNFLLKAVLEAGTYQSARRQTNFPQRFLDLPCSYLDLPLRHPDSEQAYRELVEREELHKRLIASIYAAGQSPPAVRSESLQPWDSPSQELYQATSTGWRRSSVDQRSEFLQQVLEANKDADGPCDFVCRVVDIISTTVVSTILLFLALAVPVVMITMGVKYLDDCPIERRVPVYLLVGGCFLALKLLGMLWKNVQLRRYDSMDAFYDSPDSELAFTSRTFRMMDWILSAFLLAWHVAGAYWVFSLWRPPSHPSLHQPSLFCGSSVYLCALAEILATGILLLLALLLCAVLALCYKYTNLFEQ